MSKKNTPTTGKLFNINTEAKKFYPSNPVYLPNHTGVPSYSVIKMHIPGTLRCITVPMLRRVA